MLRAQQIIIDMPVAGQEPWISVVLQDVQTDANGVVIQTVDRVGIIHRPLSKVAAEIDSVIDPVLGGRSKKLTVAGTAALIKSAVVRWIGEDYGSY